MKGTRLIYLGINILRMEDGGGGEGELFLNGHNNQLQSLDD